MLLHHNIGRSGPGADSCTAKNAALGCNDLLDQFVSSDEESQRHLKALAV
jgi:hypothetical protein